MAQDKYIVGLKLLAIYQIVGGVLGIAFIVPAFLSIDDLSYVSVILIFAGFLLHSFSVFSGIMLFRSQFGSLIMSFVCQCLQGISISTLGFFYQFVSGFSFSLYLQSLSGDFHIQFGSDFSYFSVHVVDNPYDRMIGFNFVALGIATVLYHEIKAIAREKKSDLIDSIGS